jgi:hypothetical protein
MGPARTLELFWAEGIYCSKGISCERCKVSWQHYVSDDLDNEVARTSSVDVDAAEQGCRSELTRGGYPENLGLCKSTVPVF